HESEGFCSFTKRDFFPTFWKAWERAFTKKNILSGWKKTGLFLFNPEVVLKQVTVKEKRPSSIKWLYHDNEILKQRCRRFQKTLVNREKTTRKQRPLFKLFEETGKALFFSPPTVEEAREVLRQEDKEEQRLVNTKEDQKTQRQLQKEEEERAKAEQQEIRRQNKEKRDREAAAIELARIYSGLVLN
ncbi:hypothetical protein K432DRAFT_310373, partial [Lepidopterella palustris CBS 459.81]